MIEVRCHECGTILTTHEAETAVFVVLDHTCDNITNEQLKMAVTNANVGSASLHRPQVQYWDHPEMSGWMVLNALGYFKCERCKDHPRNWSSTSGVACPECDGIGAIRQAH